MYHNGTDVIRVPVLTRKSAVCVFSWMFVHLRLERLDLLARVPIHHSQLKIVAAAYYPVFPLDESSGAYGDIGELKGLDYGLGFVGPDVCVAIVKGG